ncbi:hypothetical protein JXQ31_13645 [candidate division KSB1 bacterium]|nr:hypothetical protein [candidate division KSB1 bacterium]
MDPQKIQSFFFNEIESQAIQYPNELLRKHKQNLDSFSLLVKKLANSHKKDKKTFFDNWKKLDHFLENLKEWVNSFDCALEKYATDDLLEQYRTRVDLINIQIPDEIEIQLLKDTLQRQAREPFVLTIWKNFQKLKTGFINRSVSVLNYIRKLLGKPPLNPYIGKRRFRFFPFYAQYLEAPFIHHLKLRQNILLQIIFKQLYELHQKSENVKEELLDIEHFESNLKKLPGGQIKSELTAVNDFYKILNVYKKELENFEIETYFHYKEFREKAETDFNKAWKSAGTFHLPSRLIRLSEKSKGVDFAFHQLKSSRDAWSKHLRGERGDWLTDIELFAFQTDVALQCYHTLQIIHNKIHDRILPAIEQVNTIVQNSIKNFTIIDTEKVELRKKILLENRTLLRELGREKLPELIEMISQSKINQTFKGFLSIIEDHWSEKNDEHLIFQFRDLEHPIPNSRMDNVPLKDIVDVEILLPLKAVHEKIYLSSQQKLDDILRAISEIDQIIEYNLEAALSLFENEVKDDQIENIRQIVVEGLERTGNQVNQLKQDFQDLLEHYESILPKNTLELENEIQGLLRSEKIFELKIRYLRAQTRDKIRRYSKKFWQGFKNSIRRFWGVLLIVIHKISSGIFRLRKITRLTTAGIKIDARLSSFLTQTEDKILHLPYIYQRLFRQEPLTDKRFFFEEPKALELFRESMNDWLAGKPISVLLTGERGSGKTTILNVAEADIFTGHKIIRINLDYTVFTEQGLFNVMRVAFAEPDINSLPELESKISQNEKKIICIFENLHNLFIRTIDGFNAIERLLLLMSRTQHKVFWIATCAQYGFEYLDHVIKISKYFNRIVSPGFKNKDDIREIILKRHRMSGYNLTFNVPDDLVKSRKFLSLASDNDRQKNIQEFYFEKLSVLSAGNIRVALFFWLSSIKEIFKDKMIISPELNFDFSFISVLPADILFTFAALIQHENLNEENHALVFNQELFDSALVLSRLYNKGYLQKNGAVYFVHPFLYRPIVRVLNSRNILH